MRRLPNPKMLKLQESLHDRLATLAKSEALNILLPAGIGDTLWAMCKLRGLARRRAAENKAVKFWLPEGEQKRAGEYLQLLGVDVAYLPDLKTRWVWDRNGEPSIPERGWISAHANRTLEEGRRIETWYPDLPMEYPKPKIKARDKADEPFVLCFPCIRHYMMGQLPGWDWREMVAIVAREVAPVRMVGAGQDLEFIDEIKGAARNSADNHLLDQPFENVLAAMRSKQCVGMFGVAGGPIIAATVEGVRSFFFYPRHLVDKMPGSWEPPKSQWAHCALGQAPHLVREGLVTSFLTNASAEPVNTESVADVLHIPPPQNRTQPPANFKL